MNNKEIKDSPKKLKKISFDDLYDEFIANQEGIDETIEKSKESFSKGVRKSLGILKDETDRINYQKIKKGRKDRNFIL